MLQLTGTMLTAAQYDNPKTERKPQHENLR
jgi:hypothetical protein